MKERLQRDSPVPLYHQIAEAIRNAMAVGEIRPQQRLPPVREAAGTWGVNLHTVRRAYAELEREGLVRVRGAHGTEVVGRASLHPTHHVEAFLDSCVRAARVHFGLSASQLGQLVLRKAAEDAAPVVHVIECSATQALGHCEELMQGWRVDARPLVLDSIRELPAGVLVGTYFHYNDIRQRWPHRLGDVRFVALAPDTTLPQRLRRLRGSSHHRTLLVCELDEAKALNISADLRTLFPDDRYTVKPRVLSSAHELGKRPGPTEVLMVSPRVWGAITPAQREQVVLIRYNILQVELDTLAEDQGWERVQGREEPA